MREDAFIRAENYGHWKQSGFEQKAKSSQRLLLNYFKSHKLSVLAKYAKNFLSRHIRAEPARTDTNMNEEIIAYVIGESIANHNSYIAVKYSR